MSRSSDDIMPKGFPLTYSEISWMASWGGADSADIVRLIADWKLKNNSLVLWKIRGAGKHPYDQTKSQTIYLLPEEGEQFIQDLANLSLGHTICLLNNKDYEYRVYVEESLDGKTNIDADVLDAFSDAFKREDK